MLVFSLPVHHNSSVPWPLLLLEILKFDENKTPRARHQRPQATEWQLIPNGRHRWLNLPSCITRHTGVRPYQSGRFRTVLNSRVPPGGLVKLTRNGLHLLLRSRRARRFTAGSRAAKNSSPVTDRQTAHAGSHLPAKFDTFKPHFRLKSRPQFRSGNPSGVLRADRHPRRRIVLLQVVGWPWVTWAKRNGCYENEVGPCNGEAAPESDISLRWVHRGPEIFFLFYFILFFSSKRCKTNQSRAVNFGPHAKVASRRLPTPPLPHLSARGRGHRFNGNKSTWTFQYIPVKSTRISTNNNDSFNLK